PSVLRLYAGCPCRACPFVLGSRARTICLSSRSRARSYASCLPAPPRLPAPTFLRCPLAGWPLRVVAFARTTPPPAAAAPHTRGRQPAARLCI
ncbi:hypothetical protein OFC58_29760, partial [Escherichia coli]|nr:hypothetical protein [Escherichia coli]